MLEARIESPRGSLYYAAEATPYDLEMLRLYVRDLTPRQTARTICAWRSPSTTAIRPRR